MGMDYSKIREGIVREDVFDPEKVGKCEAVMSLGNGYLGVRSATEEHYMQETRGAFVAGTFNKHLSAEYGSAWYTASAACACWTENCASIRRFQTTGRSFPIR